MRGVVLVDTGPLVALMNRSDEDHASCEAMLTKFEGFDLVTSEACVTEAAYLLDHSTVLRSVALTFGVVLP